MPSLEAESRQASSTCSDTCSKDRVGHGNSGGYFKPVFGRAFLFCPMGAIFFGAQDRFVLGSNPNDEWLQQNLLPLRFRFPTNYLSLSQSGHTHCHSFAVRSRAVT